MATVLAGPTAPPGTFRVLAVEDNLADAILVRELLADAPGQFAMEHVERVQDATRRLLDGAFDCVLLDLSLPDAKGLEAVAHVRNVAPEIPIVVFSGADDEQAAVRAVHEGAQDYLVKGQVDPRLLSRAITYAVERKRIEVQLAHQALHDELTGLPNRALFLDRLTQALARHTRSQGSLAVLFLDLDRFKVINDSLGHPAGDALLRLVAERLAGVLRAGDTAARFGGDEFVILCEEVTGAHMAIAIAERIASAMSTPFRLEDVEEVFLHVSVGIAVADGPGVRPETLVRDADAAMYRAKERGGDGYEVFDEQVRERAVRRMATEQALHRALERQELSLRFQPLVRVATGAICGVEALVRWEHPERGVIGPGDFIPAAEETGLIHELGAWVLEQACTTIAAANAERPDHAALELAVNLSPRQLEHPRLEGAVAHALAVSELDPRLLCLELTETVLVDSSERVSEALHRLRGLGLSLAIDDFGTGYSSLSALQHHPFDVLKIDRSFVASVADDDQAAAIVAAVIGLAHALGLTCVGEGVELVAQVERLRALGCDLAQGYHFHRPLDVVQLAAVLGCGPLPGR